jgi:hypothetical protein
VTLEGICGIPSVVDANVFLGHSLQGAPASFGFEVSAPSSNREEQARRYSLFLEIQESAPIKLLSKTMFFRISAMYE